MQLFEWSPGDPAAELALDEALLEAAEAGEGPGDLLRLWQFDRPVVVIGRGSRIAGEANLAASDADGVPVLRRCSGGAAIVAGPGCLMYSLVLSSRRRPELRKVDEIHRWVMARLVAAIHRQCPQVRWQGTCDLTLDQRKFSGNSLKVARHHVLYHGTILHAFDLSSISRWLQTPPRQPDYRAGRSHADFVTNLPVDPQQLRHDLADSFDASVVEAGGADANAVALADAAMSPAAMSPATGSDRSPAEQRSQRSPLTRLAPLAAAAADRLAEQEVIAEQAGERWQQRFARLLADRYRQSSWHRRH